MKLNNKGFAITGILYGLLILFVLSVSSYLTVLSIRKNRIEKLAEDIEKDYFESKGTEPTAFPETPSTPETPSEPQKLCTDVKITIIIDDENRGNAWQINNCTSELLPQMQGTPSTISCTDNLTASLVYDISRNQYQIKFGRITTTTTCYIDY